jgi:hypothetical protein
VNGTTLESPEVAAYLAAVRAELADLPAEEREDLLADVEASLVDAGDPPALAPAAFAAELRDAAGLDPGPAAAPAGAPSLVDSLRAWASSERAVRLLATARELAPIWWLARAYVATAAIALLAGWGWPLGSGTRSYTLSIETSALVLAGAGLVSVWLGLRGRRGLSGHSRIRLAVNVALALAAIPVAVHSLDRLDERPYFTVVAAEPVSGLANSGVPIRNLYPYSRDGRLLHDVLLYDDRGLPVPIMIGFDDPLRRLLARPDGRTIRNSYPIRYYEPGTEWVARPNLAPRVNLPEIATPPLSEQTAPPDG